MQRRLSKVGMTSLLLIASLLLTTGCKSKKGAANDQKSLPVVSVITVKKQDVPIVLEQIAQTESSRLVNIQARVNGFLDKRVYTEGEMVKEGQVLFLMDKKPFEAQVAAAKAALERQQASNQTSRLNLARVKPLAELNALSQKDLDDAIGTFESTSAAVEQAKAQLITAELNLSYCTISSPLDGITSAALQQDGTYLNMTNSQLTTVARLDPIWVNFSLSENQLQYYIDQIAKKLLIPPPNEEYDVELILVNGKTFDHKGKITFKAPYYNASTGTFLIRSTVANPNGELRPNQYVRAKIIGAHRPNAILVPQRAVHQSSKGHYVMVLEKDNVISLRPVVAGEWQGNDWFINEGLNAGDRVIVDGGVNLSPGDKATVKRDL